MSPYDPPPQTDEPSPDPMVDDVPSLIESPLVTHRYFILTVATIMMAWTLIEWWWRWQW